MLFSCLNCDKIGSSFCLFDKQGIIAAGSDLTIIKNEACSIWNVFEERNKDQLIHV